jgi:hypothetical protein
MEVRQQNQSLVKDETVEAFYSHLQEHLSKVSEKVSESKTLHSIGVYDELFKFIEKANTDPLSIISDKLNGEIKEIHNFLDGMVNSFVSSHGDRIINFERAEHFNNGLYYYIVLKDNSPETKRPFLRFIFDYDQKSLSEKFPIIFDFVSSEIRDLLKTDYHSTINGRVS